MAAGIPEWIPGKQRYLAPILRDLDGLFTSDRLDEHVHQLMRSGTGQLQELIREAGRLGHLAEIPQEHQGGSEALNALYLLTAICDRLAELGSPCFADPRNRLIRPEPRYDWTRVPEALKPLIPYAVRFHRICDTERGRLIAATMSSPEDREAAVRFGRMLTTARSDALDRWLRGSAPCTEEQAVFLHARLFLEEAGSAWGSDLADP